jgi:dTDP-4-dehydrorhamnose reductase
MKILVIGASGLVGNACYQFFKKDLSNYVVGTYRNFDSENFVFFNPLEHPSSLNILDKEWDLIIHTAALTNVDLCEKDKENSYFNNVLLTKLIVDRLENSKVHFCYISTDYVFDGLDGPYLETDICKPLNIYGKHKLEAEEIVQSSLINYSILRVTNVYGEEKRNKNFVSRLVHQLINNTIDEITVPIDQFATPIYSGDIAKSIMLIHKSKATGVFHASGTDYYNRYQLVKRIVSFFPSSKINIIPIETSCFNQDAKRPLKGGLINSRLYKINAELLFTNIDTYLKKTIDGI